MDTTEREGTGAPELTERTRVDVCGGANSTPEREPDRRRVLRSMIDGVRDAVDDLLIGVEAEGVDALPLDGQEARALRAELERVIALIEAAHAVPGG